MEKKYFKYKMKFLSRLFSRKQSEQISFHHILIHKELEDIIRLKMFYEELKELFHFILLVTESYMTGIYSYYGCPFFQDFARLYQLLNTKTLIQLDLNAFISIINLIKSLSDGQKAILSSVYKETLRQGESTNMISSHDFLNDFFK